MSKNEEFKITVLAAGLGKRMKDARPKALANLHGKPMLMHLRDTIKSITDDAVIAVIGHQAELVQSELGDAFVYVIQEKQLGTAHALLSAKEALKDAKNVVVLYGDLPFISGPTIKKITERHLSSGAALTFATAEVPNFENEYRTVYAFGRIIREGAQVTAVREFKDANDQEKNIKEVNAGCFVFDAKWLWQNLEKVDNNNSQKEHYLTDLIPIALREGVKVETVGIPAREALGVNSKEELEILEKLMLE